MGSEPPIDSDVDRWHLFGVPGCIHEHDHRDYVAVEQASGSACDCEWTDPDAE